MDTRHRSQSAHAAAVDMRSANSSWKRLQAPFSVAPYSQDLAGNITGESSVISRAMMIQTRGKPTLRHISRPPAPIRRPRTTPDRSSQPPPTMIQHQPPRHHRQASSSASQTDPQSLHPPHFPSYGNRHRKNLSLTINTSSDMAPKKHYKIHQRTQSTFTPNSQQDLAAYPKVPKSWHMQTPSVPSLKESTELPELHVQAPDPPSKPPAVDLPICSPLAIDIPSVSPLLPHFQLDPVSENDSNRTVSVPPSPAIARIRNIDSYRLGPITTFSPTTGGFSKLEQEFSSYRCKESPIVKTAPSPLPAAPAVKSAKQQKRISYYVSEDDNYTVDGIDSTIQQWISVNDSAARWNYLQSPMTPRDMTPKRPLSRLQEADSQVTLTSKHESLPPTPTAAFSGFVRGELSHLDQTGNVSQIQLATVPQSPDSVDLPPASAPNLNQIQHPTMPQDATGDSCPAETNLSQLELATVPQSPADEDMTSPAPSNTTFESAEYSSVATTADWSAANSITSSISEDDQFYDSHQAPPPSSVPATPKSAHQDLVTPVALAPSFAIPPNHAAAPAPPTGTAAKRTGILLKVKTQQQKVKQAHGVVWIGEQVPNYYLPTPTSVAPGQDRWQRSTTGGRLALSAAAPLNPIAESTGKALAHHKSDSLLSRVYYDFEDDEDDEDYSAHPARVHCMAFGDLAMRRH